MKSFLFLWLFVSELYAQTSLVEKINQLLPDSPWKQLASTRLQFPSFHPQGMVKIGEYFFMSSVEVTRKRQNNDGGEGVGHLFKFDVTGKLVAQITLGEGLMYHPGGIDFDGQFIWIPVAEYRPDSRAVIYKVDPQTMKATEVMRYGDHIGAVVHNTDANILSGVSWGSRRFYHWILDKKGKPQNAHIPSVNLQVQNPAFYIAYQDCHYIGRNQMLCGGLQKYRDPNGSSLGLGGLEVVNLTDNRPVFQVPLLLWSPTGAPMTNNPFWVESTERGLRAYFVPDDDAASTLFVYEVELK
jgi:Family of unknown function (DUF6454)